MPRKYTKKPAKIGSKEPHVIALFKFIEFKKLSIREVDELSGVGFQSLHDWRNGKHSPRLDLFIAVCNSVGLVLNIEISSKRKISNPDQIELEL